MVHARLAALISSICRKIKHIPHISAPHKWMTLETFDHILMIFCLIFLSMVSTSRSSAVKVWHTFRAILGITDRAVREYKVEKS